MGIFFGVSLFFFSLTFPIFRLLPGRLSLLLALLFVRYLRLIHCGLLIRVPSFQFLCLVRVFLWFVFLTFVFASFHIRASSGSLTRYRAVHWLLMRSLFRLGLSLFFSCPSRSVSSDVSALPCLLCSVACVRLHISLLFPFLWGFLVLLLCVRGCSLPSSSGVWLCFWMLLAYSLPIRFSPSHILSWVRSVSPGG